MNDKRMFRMLGCAIYWGHQINLAPGQGRLAVASFRIWGFSIWKIGVVLGSQWVAR